MDGEFSVYQWFVDDQYEEVLRFVDPETAVNQAMDLATGIGGRMGTTKRIIITDGLDHCVFEWILGKVVFPAPKVSPCSSQPLKGQ